MNKKKIILTTLTLTLVALSSVLAYSYISPKSNAKNNEITNKANSDETTNMKNKKDSSTLVEDTFGTNLTPFEDGLTRESINGYYKVERESGQTAYAKMNDDGLSEFKTLGNGRASISFYMFTPLDTDSIDTFNYQLEGEMTNSSFTKINSSEMVAVQPNFNTEDNSLIYKRISKEEYEEGSAKILTRSYKFEALGDYYFGNRGMIGTMSKVEDVLRIDGEDFKLIKSLESDDMVIASLYGQTYSYEIYNKSNKLVKSLGKLHQN
ncbi:hypothetical protein [uncultured Clostridium sp.]|uniref:hypothetical protein n=1 Tax=uncultured Clostridium sp. TaxID=59620 RepID=UPI00262884CD|nr:hypothetical protein [uncultured Clostridium sp.]